MKNLYSQKKLAFILAVTCFALVSVALAVSPPPDGGYANQNTAEGQDALFSLTTGSNNTAIGFNALFSNTTGFDNTAAGANALLNNTIGNFNTAVGINALLSNTTGSTNTAFGENALSDNTTGSNNIAIGLDALFSNTAGLNNTATGNYALFGNLTGNNNTATGSDALGQNTGNNNTADGTQALYNNRAGINNSAIGYQSLYSNTKGNYNTGNGQGSLYSNTNGSNNTAVGQNALSNNTTGKGNVALGSNAGLNLTTGSDNIAIYDRGVAGETNTTRIGKQGTQRTTYIAGISGATVAGGVGVIVDATGHLGTVTSSARYKDGIRTIDRASEAILSLEPVTFRYKKELDPQGIPQFGLVAEEVEKVNPDLVARDEQGKPYTVRYEAVNAMLLNEFLKEHRKVEEQSGRIAAQDCKVQQLEATVAQLQLALKEQAAQIQKVSTQVNTQNPVQRVVADN